MHHQGDAEERRQQVEDRHHHQRGDDGAGGEHRSAVLGPHPRRLLERAEAPGRELEIFAAEQIGVGDEEDADIHARDEEQQQRREVDEQRQPGKAQAVEDRAADGQRPARRIGGKVGRLDHLGHVVEKIAGDDAPRPPGAG